MPVLFENLPYKTICLAKRKCDIAIKITELNSSSKKVEHADNEKKSVENFIKKPQPNIIEYFGCFDDGMKRCILMELGQETLSKYLNKNVSRLSIPQFHEIMFQTLEIIDQLDLAGIFHGDFNGKNIVLLNGKLKLIDFDFSKRVGEDDYMPPVSHLRELSSLFSKIQLEMKLKGKNDLFWQLLYFDFYVLQDDLYHVTSRDICNLLENRKIWHDELPVDTRAIICKCSIDKPIVQREIVKNRNAILPRGELIFKSDPVGQH